MIQVTPIMKFDPAIKEVVKQLSHEPVNTEIGLNIVAKNPIDNTRVTNLDVTYRQEANMDWRTKADLKYDCRFIHGLQCGFSSEYHSLDGFSFRARVHRRLPPLSPKQLSDWILHSVFTLQEPRGAHKHQCEISKKNYQKYEKNRTIVIGKTATGQAKTRAMTNAEWKKIVDTFRYDCKVDYNPCLEAVESYRHVYQNAERDIANLYASNHYSDREEKRIWSTTHEQEQAMYKKCDIEKFAVLDLNPQDEDDLLDTTIDSDQ